MKFEVGFGKATQTVEIPENRILQVLHANPVQSGPQGEAAVRQALLHPIGTPRLRDIVKPHEKIVIVTSDITRPMPTAQVMPALLEELDAAGAAPEDITLVFARGSHRAHTEDEMRKLAGEDAYRRIRCIDSDPEDCLHLGTTKLGTPVDIMRIVAEADRRICLGNIEYHYFAGYSGGAKAIMPGTSTPAAIQVNHAHMTEAKAHAGNLEDNPIRKDLEEATAICGIDFIVNVVLDEHKNIVHAVAGDWIQAHREGCSFLDSMYQVEIPQRADIVIASQGGAPKDLNLYQTQKALDNAKHAVKDGGTIILVGSCKEGLGQKTFEEWMQAAAQPQDLIRRIESDFQLGGHKAAAIAMVLEKAKIKLVSDMDASLVRSIFLQPYHNLQQAYDDAAAEHGNSATVIIMPYGGSTLPKVR